RVASGHPHPKPARSLFCGLGTHAFWCKHPELSSLNLMNDLNRRTFLKTAAGFGVASTLVRSSAWAQPKGANDAIRLAIVGLGSKGTSHLRNILKMPDVRIAGLCDPDESRMARAVRLAQEAGVSPPTALDARRIFERDDVDAVLIASPDHWHATHAVWACQAGKDVYVEKPVANTIWEGRQIIEAGRRHNRIVQAGTQARSDPGIQQAVEHVRAGHLGKILWVHALWYKRREPIGRRLPWYPEGVDFDLFCGPAPMKPLVRDKLHYDWHWFWETGNGEMTNLGVHCVDMARWFAGHRGAPPRVCSVGGRYVVDDSGETPNTQIGVFEYPDIPIIMECRGLPAEPGAEHMDNFRGIRHGVVVQCEDGYFAGHYGGAVYDNNRKRIQAFPGDGGDGHMANFLEAVRSRRSDALAAPIEEAQLSSATCLLANVSHRLGEPAPLEEARAVVDRHEFSRAAFDNMVTHLGRHGVDLERDRLRVGGWLQVDESGETIAGVGEAPDDATLERAHHFAHGIQRPPYVIA
ncbi:MAG: Gfo/Idh/MocA family protein, partial [Opitutaceae bacterium]